MTELEKDLEAFQSEEIENKDTFVVDSLEKASWCMKQIQIKERKKEEIKRLVEYEKTKLDMYLAQETKEPDSSIEFFKSKLLPYVSQKIEGEKKKSINLPCGTAGFRATPANIEKNKDVLLEWVKTNKNQYVKTEETVLWADLKEELKFENGQAITTDGEVVPGITVEEKEPIFYVKVEV
jgi:hypothetical protein